MDSELINPDDPLFGDIYIYDKEVEKKIIILTSCSEYKHFMAKARKEGSAIHILNDILPNRKVPAIPKLISKLKPFYKGDEYKTKENYLHYLKQVYGFLQTPFEVPPGRVLSTFYPNLKRTWSQDSKTAEDLLTKFYIEFKLISELSEKQWNYVATSDNPEMAINKLIFKAEFKSDFAEFLRTIPWIMSHDAYGAPGLDLMYRTKPGNKLPKKPFGVGDSFLKLLVSASQMKRAHTLLWVDDAKVKLTNKGQIMQLIAETGQAHIDSFIGLSKVERDFVVHKHIIIWKNPGLKRYERAHLFKKMVYLKPPEYLCIIREEALPLDIPFIKKRPSGFK
jgi:hypothetical protein